MNLSRQLNSALQDDLKPSDTKSSQRFKRLLLSYRRLKGVYKQLAQLIDATTRCQSAQQFFPYLNDFFTNSIKNECFYVFRQTDQKAVELVFSQGEPFLPEAAGSIGERIFTQLQISPRTCHLKGTSPIALKLPRQLEYGDDWLIIPMTTNNCVVGFVLLGCRGQLQMTPMQYQIADFAGEQLAYLLNYFGCVARGTKQGLSLSTDQENLKNLSMKLLELEQSNRSLVRQVEEKQKMEQQLYFDAHHDALTKLPNRAMFRERLIQALAHVKRFVDHRFAVLFIDLDRFKLINDTLGHQAGDEFLIEISRRIGHSIRENDLLARLGGDEFVVLLDLIESDEHIEEVARRIIEAVKEPFYLNHEPLYSNASIGVAICDNRYQDAMEVLRDADAAMYQAKALGRGRYVFFDESMREQLLEAVTLEQECRVALSEQQFELHFQKITNLENQRCIGFEALLRWRHPQKGLLTPAHFLEVAAESGLLIEIESWVISQAAKKLKEWQYGENREAFISVNLSAKYLSQPKLLKQLVDQVKQQFVDPTRLLLEFSEASFTRHHAKSIVSLNELKNLGVRLALDDYGSGLSSLNFIHKYPFEFVKLHRGFTRHLTQDSKHYELLKILQLMGKTFNFNLVAGGIESPALMEKVMESGCTYGQGYFIAKPERIEDEQAVEPVLVEEMVG